MTPIQMMFVTTSALVSFSIIAWAGLHGQSIVGIPTKPIDWFGY
jgi:hypothetical protein